MLMSSKVYFSDARASSRRSRLDKVRELIVRADLASVVAEGDRVAIKVHWGEPGNVAFLPPPYVRLVAEQVRKAGGLPFVTDANTLYTGMRRDAVQNLLAAAHNGYTQETLTAPVIVADGLKGRDGREVDLPGTSVGKAKIASGILDADAMVVLSHVKGHMLMGFGGALKNLGMGCATPAGKQILHSDVRPRVEAEKCRGDGACVKRCPERCIELVERSGATGAASRRVARIDAARCIGCGECTAACPHEAIPVRWKTSAEAIQRKTAEYALAAVKDKPGKVGYLNFLLQVTPDCDCCHWSDNAFVPDVGFLASNDPVAIDAASLDLVRAAPPLPGSRAEGCRGDPWRAVYDIDPNFILEHGEKLRLGSRDYKLIKV
jgi:uncharacterized Fe-S center protein